MTDSVVINFNGDPVAKGRPRLYLAKGKPMAYTPAKTRKYEAALQYAAQEAMGNRLRFLGAVSVSIVASLPVPQSWSKKKQTAALEGTLFPISRPDVDNYQKLAFDALNAVVLNDDSQVVFSTVRKIYSERPSLRIEVREIAHVAQVEAAFAAPMRRRDDSAGSWTDLTARDGCNSRPPAPFPQEAA